MSVDITTATSMDLQAISDVALGTLIQKIEFINSTTRGFANLPQSHGTYTVPTLAGGATGVRAIDGTVTPVTPTVSSVSITATQPYYSVEFDESMLSSNIERHMDSFIQEGTRLLAKAIETLAFKTIALQTDVSQYRLGLATESNPSSNVNYEDLTGARTLLKNAGFADGDLHVAVTHEAMEKLLAETELSNYNVLGFPGVPATGNPYSTLYGFVPHASSYIHSPHLVPATAWTGALNEAGNILAGTTSFAYDTGSPNLGCEPMQIHDIDNEYYLCVSIANEANTTGTITAIRGCWNTAAAAHNDDAVLTSMANKVHLAYAKSAVMHIFPPQETFSDARGVKVGSTYDGISLYIYREPNASKNGGLIYTMSTNFGIKAIRPTGVVKIIKAV